jgi:carbonic anhydrase
MNSMTTLMVFFFITELVAQSEWDYEKLGPDIWFKAYEKCSGNIQSPINIDDENGITYDKSLLPFVFSNYEKTANFDILNNGETGLKINTLIIPIYFLFI